jgi:hypothetical protein
VIFRITVSCADCHTTFRIQRSLKPIAFKQPTHCLDCGSTHVGIVQDHELDCDECMAEHFNLTLTKYKQVYDVWHGNFADEYPHLVDFIAYLRRRNAGAPEPDSKSSS